MCFYKNGVDLFYVENLKKIFLEFMNLIKCNIVVVFPDRNIRSLKEEMLNKFYEASENKRSITWLANESLTDKLLHRRTNKRCKTLYFKKAFKEDGDFDKVYNTDLKKYRTVSLIKSAVFQEDQKLSLCYAASNYNSI